MTAHAAAFQLAEQGYTSERTVAGALLLACDLIDDLQDGKALSALEIEFVGHCRELAEGVAA